MEAGRALDALIAEKVMGLTVSARNRECYLMHGDQYPEGSLGADLDYIPLYSSAMPDAWLVVEKLVADGRMVHVNNYGHGDWFAQVGLLPPFPDERRLWDIHAPTAPHAICLAALKAVEASSGQPSVEQAI